MSINYNRKVITVKYNCKVMNMDGKSRYCAWSNNRESSLERRPRECLEYILENVMWRSCCREQLGNMEFYSERGTTAWTHCDYLLIYMYKYIYLVTCRIQLKNPRKY